jgi:hypothetical protein
MANLSKQQEQIQQCQTVEHLRQSLQQTQTGPDQPLEIDSGQRQMTVAHLVKQIGSNTGGDTPAPTAAPAAPANQSSGSSGNKE